MIVAKDIRIYSYGDNVLIDNSEFIIKPKEKVALVGNNGCGKTTLINTIIGKRTLDYGSISIPKEWKISWVEQELDNLEISALDYVINGDKEYVYWNNIYEQAHILNDANKMSDALNNLSVIDAWTIRSRSATILKGLRLTDYMMKQPVKELSGGWRFRLNLARALIVRSDLLLLDEPTNHLDLDAIYWLENYLKQYHGTIILISHDQDFIDTVVNKVIHIENKKFFIYGGNYSYFQVKRTENIEIINKQYKQQQKKINQLQSFVDRFKAKNSKASQAKSKMKAIEKLDVISSFIDSLPFKFSFHSSNCNIINMIELRNASIGYSKDKIILNDANISIESGDKISLLGVNGAGKSTLIKAMASELKPYSGVCNIHPNLKIGYFTQHSLDSLTLDATPMWHMQKISSLNELDIRKYLGNFNFIGDKVFDKVGVFSGGEKSRLMLALIAYQKPDILLLDEPTNNFDIDMRQALSQALLDFKGSVVLVSHDRYLLNLLTDNYYLISDGKVEKFKGGLNEYYRWLLDYDIQKEIRKNREECIVGSVSNNLLESKMSSKYIRDSNKRINSMISSNKSKISKKETSLFKIDVRLNEISNLFLDVDIYASSNKDKLSLLIEEEKALKLDKYKIEDEIINLEIENDELILQVI